MCIYCYKDKPASNEEVHVFPEAIVANEGTLPSGAVCPNCNNYFGNELDDAVVRHPYLATCIQVLGLHGKRGLRHSVGPVKRLSDGSLALELPPEAVKREGSTLTTTILPDHNFSLGRFRRSLHYIAFNLLCAGRGCDHARKPHYDAVRRYVREPRRNEAWAIVIVPRNLGTFEPIVSGQLVTNGPGETTMLRMFDLDFYVDLLNRGALIHWCQSRFGSSAEYIFPDFKPDPAPPRSGKHRFRLRLPPGGESEGAT